MNFERILDLKPNKLATFNIQNIKIRLKLEEKVFLPHPDSLLLANSIKINPGEKVLDLGLGTGILAITAAKLGASKVFGTDTNSKAIKNSQKNAILNNVSEKCVFAQGNFFEPFRNEKFDVIIANAPQIPGPGNEEKYFSQATNGGLDGTIPTIKILRSAAKHMNKGGRIYFPLKEWMDWKRVLKEAGHLYTCRKIAETFSPVWTKDKVRLHKISNLIKRGRARRHLINGKVYYKICVYEFDQFRSNTVSSTFLSSSSIL